MLERQTRTELALIKARDDKEKRKNKHEDCEFETFADNIANDFKVGILNLFLHTVIKLIYCFYEKGCKKSCMDFSKEPVTLIPLLHRASHTHKNCNSLKTNKKILKNVTP